MFFPMFLQKDTVIFLCVYKKFEDFFCAVFHFTYFNLYLIFVILMLKQALICSNGSFLFSHTHACHMNGE